LEWRDVRNSFEHAKEATLHAEPTIRPTDDGEAMKYKEKRTKRLTLRLPESVFERLGAAARIDGRSMSDWSLRAIEHMLRLKRIPEAGSSDDR
jgi:hypothetical protein